MSTWSRLVESVRYGYTPLYVAQVEGIDMLFVERLHDLEAPEGGSLSPTLVIDQAPRIGTALNSESYFAAAFDLELRLLDAPEVRGLFSRPTRFARLTAPLSAAATSASVDRAGDWSTSKLHIGTSCEVWGGTWTQQSFDGLTRGVYGRAKTYPAGALVTDRPRQWEGRQVTLWLVMVDPLGSVVLGNLLGGDPADANAVVAWSGHIQDRPRRAGTEWVIRCRDQVRRLQQPLGVAASGRVRWAIDSDQEHRLQWAATVTLRLIVSDTIILDTWLLDASIPLGNNTEYLQGSEIRARLRAGLEAISTHPYHRRYAWRSELEAVGSVARRVWKLYVVVEKTPNFLATRAFASAEFVPSALRAQNLPDGSSYSYASGEVESWTGFSFVEGLSSASLEVTLDDDGDASSVPAWGVVALETDGQQEYRRYISAVPHELDSRIVRLRLDEASTNPNHLAALAAQIAAGELAEVSARFLWADDGPLDEILCRALASTGDGNNGPWDTLPRGQGLGLPYIDSASFARVFGGVFQNLRPQILVDAGMTIEKIFSGLLRLSQCAIVPRRDPVVGMLLGLSAVSVGSAEGVPTVRITDELLVSDGGRWPVTQMALFEAPQSIETTCRTVPIGASAGGDGVITYRAPDLTDWSKLAWKLDLYGIPREALAPARTLGLGYAWSTAWFRSAETRQVVRLTVPGWLDVQVGDVVDLDLQDPNLWDYAAGQPGLRGLARVIGVQLSLRTLVQEITVVADGVLAAPPMSPSLPILAVNGSGTAPTSIDTSPQHYELLMSVKSTGSWSMLAYLPGQDHGHARYTVSTVALVGGVTRITVVTPPSSPTINLSTDWRLTWPPSHLGTAGQDRYLHTNHQVQWT